MIEYPNPEWVADEYACNAGHITQRFRLPSEDTPWAGVVKCRHCNAETSLVNAGAVVKPVSLRVRPTEPVAVVPAPLRAVTPDLLVPGPTYADLINSMERT